MIPLPITAVVEASGRSMAPPPGEDILSGSAFADVLAGLAALGAPLPETGAAPPTVPPASPPTGDPLLADAGTADSADADADDPMILLALLAPVAAPAVNDASVMTGADPGAPRPAPSATAREDARTMPPPPSGDLMAEADRKPAMIVDPAALLKAAMPVQPPLSASSPSKLLVENATAPANPTAASGPTASPQPFSIAPPVMGEAMLSPSLSPVPSAERPPDAAPLRVDRNDAPRPEPVAVPPIRVAAATEMAPTSASPAVPMALQLAQQLAAALPRLQQTGGAVQLTLDPARLGRVTLSWAGGAGGSHALRIVAAEPATAQLLGAIREQVATLLRGDPAAPPGDRPPDFRVEVVAEARTMTGERRPSGEPASSAGHGFADSPSGHGGSAMQGDARRQAHRQPIPQTTGETAVNPPSAPAAGDNAMTAPRRMA